MAATRRLAATLAVEVAGYLVLTPGEVGTLLLRRIQMVPSHWTRHARPCAGHPRKSAKLASLLVGGRDEPGHDGLNPVSASER
jgi:hypothetical protein